MKKYLWMALLPALLFAPARVFARLQADAFDEKTELTAGQIFLNQVDTVALYLKTANVVYVPRLTGEKKLSVELVLLGRRPAATQEGIRELAMRHIRTFNKTLKERLEFYTPKLANDFDFKNDVAFRVVLGAKKETVARWENGEWRWVMPATSALATARVAPENSPTSKKEKCPALIKPKPKEKTPVAEVSTPAVEEKPIEETSLEETPAAEKPADSGHVHQGQQKKL